MKKILATTLLSSTILISPLLSNTTYADSNITVYYNGQQIQFDTPPVIQDGYTLVEFRPLFEALGYDIKWYPNDGGSIWAVKWNDYIHVKSIDLTIGHTLGSIDGKNATLDVAPQIINGHAIVPLRFVADASGATVNWDANTRTISIQDTPSVQTTTGNTNSTSNNTTTNNADQFPDLNSLSTDSVTFNDGLKVSVSSPFNYLDVNFVEVIISNLSYYSMNINSIELGAENTSSGSKYSPLNLDKYPNFSNSAAYKKFIAHVFMEQNSGTNLTLNAGNSVLMLVPFNFGQDNPDTFDYYDHDHQYKIKFPVNTSINLN